MTTERIDIVIRENGSRVVSRNIREIGTVSKETDSAVKFLRNTLAGIGAATAVAQVVRLLDTYNILQNRLRSTGLEAQKLTAVYQKLFSVSNETRSSLKSSVELYSRLAVNAKNLGASQESLIGFTKSLNQAVILSGAGMVESENAIIQLSQGMASGVLQGDELRSVLEQLPIVADVIAKHMNITRGQLRKLGSEGKISAETILAAFESAREELENRFANTIPTIGQSFVVLKNYTIDLLGRFDEAVGLTKLLSLSMYALAQNLEFIGKTIIITASAYGVFWASVKLGELTTLIQNWVEYRKQIAAGTVVILGSAEAERQKAAHTLQSAVASAAAAGSTLRSVQSEELLAASKLNSIRATQAQMAAERQLELVRLKAQITDIGRTESLARLAEIRKSELVLTKLVAREEVALAAAQVATLSATNARAQAMDRVTTAQAGLAATTARAAGSTTLLGQAVSVLKGVFSRLWAVISAHPLAALVTALVAAGVAIYAYQDQIDLGVDKTTKLSHLFKAFGEVVSETVAEIKKSIGGVLEPVIKQFENVFGTFGITLIGFLRGIASFVDTAIGLWKAYFSVIVDGAKLLPNVVKDLTIQLVNSILNQLTTLVNKVGNVLKPLTDFAGIDQIIVQGLQVDNDVKGAASTFGSDLAKIITDSFNSSTSAQDFLGRITKRAQELSKSVKTEDTLNKPGKSDPAVSEKLRKDLDRLLSSIDPVGTAIRDLAEAEGVLNQAQKEGLITKEQTVKYMELLNNTFRDAIDPLGAINRELDSHEALLKLTGDEYEREYDLLQMTNQLRQQGVILNEKETNALRERLKALQDINNMAEAKQSLLSDSTDRRKEFSTQLGAINQLSNDPNSGFTKGDKAQATQGLLEGMNLDTRGAGIGGDMDPNNAARIQQTQMMYDQLLQMREADLISEQQYSGFRAQIWAQEQESKFSLASDFFGTLAQMQKSENKKAAAIGKAAAITQAIIQTYLAATSAYAAMAAIPVVGPALGGVAAAAAIVAGMQNVSQIRAQQPGFMTGGQFTIGGSGGADSQYVAFRGTPGEKVEVSTPTQVRKNKERQKEALPGRALNVTIHQNIQVSGKPDNRTSTQMASDAAAKQKLAMMRFS